MFEVGLVNEESYEAGILEGKVVNLPILEIELTAITHQILLTGGGKKVKIAYCKNDMGIVVDSNTNIFKLNKIVQEQLKG